MNAKIAPPKVAQIYCLGPTKEYIKVIYKTCAKSIAHFTPIGNFVKAIKGG